MMRERPVNAIAAIVVALLPLPAMKLLDHLNRGCGDGLCGFFSGLLILGVFAIATLILIARSTRREETPALLRLAPIVLWILALIPLTH